MYPTTAASQSFVACKSKLPGRTNAKHRSDYVVSLVGAISRNGVPGAAITNLLLLSW